MSSPKTTQCTLNTLLQNYSWKWTPGRQNNNLKFPLENGESKGRAPTLRYQQLVMPEQSLMACDKWDMSTAPTVIHNEIKVKWFVSLFSLSSHNEDGSPLRYWWSDYFLLLAYQAFSPQRITARIMQSSSCGCTRHSGVDKGPAILWEKGDLRCNAAIPCDCCCPSW